jgi:uncharacterized metal-binding protein YceD (DUF177 family)
VSKEIMPWRATVAVTDIRDHGLHRDIEAGDAERQAIATMAGLRELSRLTASLDLSHAGGGQVRVVGHVRATVGQTCVVTLEPLTSEVQEDIDVMFSPDAPVAAEASQAHDDDDTPVADPPEPIVGGEIDLGALAAEFLILGLDPYPRKPGVVFEPLIQPADPADHPFAALAALKASDSPAKPKSRSKTKGK